MCICHMYWTSWAQNVSVLKELDSVACLTVCLQPRRSLGQPIPTGPDYQDGCVSSAPQEAYCRLVMVGRKLSPEKRPPKWGYREWFSAGAHVRPKLTFKGYEVQGDILSRVAWMAVFTTIPGWWQQNVFAHVRYCQTVITARAWGQGREHQGLPHEGHGMTGSGSQTSLLLYWLPALLAEGLRPRGFAEWPDHLTWTPLASAVAGTPVF